MATSAELIIYVFAICSILATIGIFAIFFFLMVKKRERIHLKKIEALNKEMLKTRIEIQEQTFAHISRELHDNIGQSMALAGIHLNSLDNETETGKKEKIDSAKNIIADAMSGIRDISKSMLGEKILQQGLVEAVKHELKILEKSKRYTIGFSRNDEYFNLDNQSQVIIFRIVQEALHNIMKHANATAINVDFYYTEKDLTITIADNGQGFDTSQKSDGVGQQSMRSRAQMIDAQLNIASGHEGTTITIVQLKKPPLAKK